MRRAAKSVVTNSRFDAKEAPGLPSYILIVKLHSTTGKFKRVSSAVEEKRSPGSASGSNTQQVTSLGCTVLCYTNYCRTVQAANLVGDPARSEFTVAELATDRVGAASAWLTLWSSAALCVVVTLNFLDCMVTYPIPAAIWLFPWSAYLGRTIGFCPLAQGPSEVGDLKKWRERHRTQARHSLALLVF